MKKFFQKFGKGSNQSKQAKLNSQSSDLSAIDSDGELPSANQTSILDQINQDMDLIQKVRESNHIDRKNVNELFVKTLRKDSDSNNNRVFIPDIDDDYMLIEPDSTSHNLKEDQVASCSSQQQLINNHENFHQGQSSEDQIQLPKDSKSISSIKATERDIEYQEEEKQTNKRVLDEKGRSQLEQAQGESDLGGWDRLDESSTELPQDEELLRYIQDMIEMLSTEDEEVNQQNKQMLVKQIQAKLIEQGVKTESQHIEKFLDELKSQQFSQAKTAEEKRKMLSKMTEAFYTLGYMSYYAQSQSQCATAAVQLGLQGGSIETLSQGLLSKTAWIAVAFIYTAQTGLNYRKLKKGQISKKEFWHRVKINSVTTVSSLAGGSGGAAAGFAIGTAMMPGVGSVIGAVVGGIAGGFAGEKLSAKAYNAIDARIEKAKEKKRLKQQQALDEQRRAQCRVSEEQYDKALGMLGIASSSTSLEDIEQSYINILEVLNSNKCMEQNRDIEKQKEFTRKFHEIIDAYEDVKEYRYHHQIYI